MQFDLGKMEDLTVAFDLKIEPEKADLSERLLRLKTAAAFSGKAKRDGWLTNIKGSAEAVIERTCDRCLKKVDVPVTFEVDSSYIYFDKLDKESEEELEARDRDYAVCGSPELDLIDVFCEQLLLSVDFRFVCSAECKGLCPDCGERIDEKACDCGEKRVDPRWSALKNLKVK